MAILIKTKFIVLEALWSLVLLVTKKKGHALIALAFFSFISEASMLKNLQKKYPHCTLIAKSYFLTNQDKELFKKNHAAKSVQSFYSYFTKTCQDKHSYVFVLSDIVRTHRQFILFEYDKESLVHVELLKFLEPKEYQAPKNWYHHLSSLAKNKEFKVDTISGATLTSRSANFLLVLSHYLNKVVKSN